MKRVEDKIFLVTGSTDGIGKQTALQLAKIGATVILHGRSKEKCMAVMEEIHNRTGNHKLRYYLADFSSLTDVRRMAKEVSNQEVQIDVLINNAGIGSGKLSNKRRSFSQDGYELRFAVNYLAPFLLTQLLLLTLKASSPSRIINVASIGQKRIDLDNVMLERNYDPFDAYKQSKLALIMYTFELAQKLKSENITVNCLHPGSLLNTKMVRESIPIAFGSVKSGAASVVHLAISEELNHITGKYFDKKQESQVDPQAYDRDFRQKLWEYSEQLTMLDSDIGSLKI
ncbi:SDR family oxidoreductase [Bacillus sp. 03113]|uniref:SDR family oxidoreductase n=1 Tax=Bacillus sp. 03113 TaxID=2578211 RepID=UPI0011423CE8|nr:SDR family oxidoreductase [Bacillus sp. 03113]